MKTLLEDELPAQAYGRLLLAAGAKPPAAVVSRGRQVCTCFNVTDAQIGTCLGRIRGDEDRRLAQLQAQLQCGTHCGSCVPELKRMIRMAQPQLSI
jgi:assimilatory nitrate reductase catalytic subunit